jgi:hypothetical protein
MFRGTTLRGMLLNACAQKLRAFAVCLRKTEMAREMRAIAIC